MRHVLKPADFSDPPGFALASTAMLTFVVLRGAAVARWRIGTKSGAEIYAFHGRNCSHFDVGLKSHNQSIHLSFNSCIPVLYPRLYCVLNAN